MNNFQNYNSPFSWRYGSKEMREFFSEIKKRKTWRLVWVALAKSQYKLGLISKKELDDIQKHKDNIDLKTAQKIEDEIKHDLMSEVRTFARQAKIGGGKIHLGATSQDIEDNAEAILFKGALLLVEKNIKELLGAWTEQIIKNKDTVCMAYTHLQPAEPTTLGYRFSFYAQDLLLDLDFLQYMKKNIKGKGIKGAVGNYASYVSLLGSKAQSLEKDVMTSLGLESFDVTTQTYPRKVDYLLLTLLSSIAQSLYKFAQDLRIMQSPNFGEVAEPFGKKQVGSSAMPFKRNPQNSEKICSLARYVAQLPRVAWDNAANSMLERTLDDSAARRIIIPEAFLAIDEMLAVSKFIVTDLTINTKNIQRNLDTYGPFSALETILLKSTKHGANRQQMHEILRNHALAAYDDLDKIGRNTLFENIQKDKKILSFLKIDEIKNLSNYKNHVGLSAEKAQETVLKIKKSIA